MKLSKIKKFDFEVEGQLFSVCPCIYEGYEGDEDEPGIQLNYPEGCVVTAPLWQFPDESSLNQWIKCHVEYWFKGVAFPFPSDED